MRFGQGGQPLANAVVDIPSGATGVGAGYVQRLETGTPSFTFYVRRLAPGAVTVPVTVSDGCGEWSTFVGGGAASF